MPPPWSRNYYPKKKTTTRKRTTTKKAPVYFELYGPELDRTKTSYRSVTIDPGYKNLAFGLVERDRFLTKSRLKLLHFNRTDDFLQRIMTSLHSIFSRWSKDEPIDFVVMEQQMKVSKYPRIVSDAILGYFALHHPLTPVYMVSPSLKGKRFKRNGIDIKVQTVGVAIEILEQRGDYKSIKRIRREKKDDDLSDIVVQEEEFCNLLELIPDKFEYGGFIECEI